MALVKDTLTAAILEILNSPVTEKSDNSVTRQQFAEKLSTAIDTYIRSATVTVAPGIALTASGAAGAVTGSTTGTGTGSIS